MLRPATEDEASGARRDGRPSTGILEGMEDVVRQIGILVDVRAERARLRVRRTAERVGIALCLGAAMLILVGAGAALLVIGLVAVLRARFAESPGVGDLLAGFVLLAIPLTAAWLLRIRLERRELARLAAKFEEAGGTHGQDPSDG